MMLPPVIKLARLQVTDGCVRIYMVAVFIIIIKSGNIGIYLLCDCGIKVEACILFFPALVSIERTSILYIIELKLFVVRQ